MAPSTSTVLESLRHKLETDENLRRVADLARCGARNLAANTGGYFVDKVPIARWLPKYSKRWILPDVVAGLTVGMLLIPQSLAYAKLANIPLTAGLVTSWIPPLLYAAMGTSKGECLSSDIVSGPTTLMGLLTGELVTELAKEGFTASAIASAITFVVGIYGILLGFFKLGFVLNFISIPVLNGFFSAAGLTILLSQVASLLGEPKGGSGTANVIHDIFANLPQAKGATVAVGFSGIFLLVLMQKAGQLWGKKSKVIWFISICRNAIIILIFTTISFGVNNGLKTPVFEISAVGKTTIGTPTLPSGTLIGKVAGSCVTIVIAVAIEHLAIAKSFAGRNGYAIDESQELAFIGVSNIVNGFFATMPSGGAFSRTAVNSESGVKSPLTGLITSGFVVLSIYFFTGALFWIPKATLSAIVITAVWSILVPPKVFYSYYRTSLADFIASMISFWTVLFVSVETGIALAVGFSIAHILLRTMFTNLIAITSLNISTISISNPFEDPVPSRPTQSPLTSSNHLPDNTKIFKVQTSILFLNAYRIKNILLNTIQVCTLGAKSTTEKSSEDRVWSDTGNTMITQLRSTLTDLPSPLPKLKIVILDLDNVAFIDITGLKALQDAKKELDKYSGNEVELRLVGMNDDIRSTFERSGWGLVDVVGEFDWDWMDGRTAVFGSVAEAVWAGRVEVLVEKSRVKE